MKEADLHKLVADYLDLALMPPAWWSTFPADGASRRGRIGLKRGVPDILIIHERGTYWIELKAARGRASPTQYEMHEALKTAGANAVICQSLEAVNVALRAWGIPLNPAVRISA